ncbi:TPA: hypothetical protein U0J99_000656 [Streptococcus suis]|nr:hypothetical protein [Streptococcus suis]
MSKQDSLKKLEEKVEKQRETVAKEQEKLASLENDFYKAFHEQVRVKATTMNMSVSEYLDAMS